MSEETGGTQGASGAREPVEAGIATGALARRLGVSATTVRSWDRRYGIGPAVRSDGRHRRWAPRDVAVLEEMCRLTASGVPPAEAARAAQAAAGTAPAPTSPASAGPPRPATRQPAAGSGLPLGDVRQECRGLARAAVRLDGPAVDALLTDLVERHGLVVAWEEVMAPTLRAVGRKWQTSGERYVEVEHLLSWHVSSALRRVRPAPTVTGAAPVLLACVPGDHHTLPLEALTAGLGELGLSTRMFGGAVPVDALDEAVRRIGPAAVVLWSQSRSTADRPLARHVAATSWGVKGARTHPMVFLAGPGWAGPLMPGMLRPQGLRDALSALSRIGSPTPPSTAAP
ncbi:MerR family transcriptional regulator [Streptomyces sp. NPDC003300]|uniref:MerR family transcriptional regulator n=1 Tax=unclassified Streptomyces TaxID=2593676 RepID=UPI0033A6786E